MAESAAPDIQAPGDEPGIPPLCQTTTTNWSTELEQRNKKLQGKSTENKDDGKEDLAAELYNKYTGPRYYPRIPEKYSYAWQFEDLFLGDRGRYTHRYSETLQSSDIIVLDVLEDGSYQSPKLFGRSPCLDVFKRAWAATNPNKTPPEEYPDIDLETVKFFLSKKPAGVSIRLFLVNGLNALTVDLLGRSLDLNPGLFYNQILGERDDRGAYLRAIFQRSRLSSFEALPQWSSAGSFHRTFSWVERDTKCLLEEIEKLDHDPSFIRCWRTATHESGFRLRKTSAAKVPSAENPDSNWTGVFLFEHEMVPDLACVRNNCPKRGYEPCGKPISKDRIGFRRGSRNSLAWYLLHSDNGTPSATKSPGEQYEFWLLSSIMNEWNLFTFSVLDCIDEIELKLSNNAVVREHVNEWRDLLGRLRNYIVRHEGGVEAMAKRIQKMKGQAVGDDLGIRPAVVLLDWYQLGIKAPLWEEFEGLAERLANVKHRIEWTMSALMSAMSIVESEKAIAEAEGVAKLTELAFIFIPSSFAASIFGMNIVGWSEHFKPYMFLTTLFSVLVGSYVIRIATRSKFVTILREGCKEAARDYNEIAQGEKLRTSHWIYFLYRVLREPLRLRWWILRWPWILRWWRWWVEIAINA